MRIVPILFAIACGTPTEEPVDHWQAPDADGFWIAGASTHTVTGSTGVELETEVWFPAASADDDAWVYAGMVEGGAFEDGEPDCTEPRPVVMFSHGNGGLRYQSYFLTEHLARHGYLVVAPDHTGNTLSDLDSIPRGEMAVRRPQDISDSFDWLVSEAEDTSSPLHGCVDASDGFAMIGHSFGGYTTLAVSGATLDLEGLTTHCATDGDFICGAEEAWASTFPNDDSGDLSDDRAWAAIPLAPAGAIGFGSGLAGITIPTLVIGGVEDGMTTWQDEVEPIYRGLTTAPRALAGLERTGHFTFTNVCTSALDGCGDDALPLEEAHGLIRTLSLAWLDVTRGETRSAPWLPPEDAPTSWESVD